MNVGYQKQRPKERSRSFPPTIGNDKMTGIGSKMKFKGPPDEGLFPPALNLDRARKCHENGKIQVRFLPTSQVEKVSSVDKTPAPLRALSKRKMNAATGMDAPDTTKRV